MNVQTQNLLHDVSLHLKKSRSADLLATNDVSRFSQEDSSACIFQLNESTIPDMSLITKLDDKDLSFSQRRGDKSIPPKHVSDYQHLKEEDNDTLTNNDIEETKCSSMLKSLKNQPFQHVPRKKQLQEGIILQDEESKENNYAPQANILKPDGNQDEHNLPESPKARAKRANLEINPLHLSQLHNRNHQNTQSQGENNQSLNLQTFRLSVPGRENTVPVQTPSRFATQNTRGIVTLGQDQALGEQQDQIAQSLMENGLKLYLRRRIAFFLTLMVCSMFLRLIAEKEASYRGIACTIYCFFIYHIIENVIAIRGPQQIEAWQKREHKLDILMTLNHILGFLLIDLKLANVLPYSAFAAIPFALNTLIYNLKSTAPDETKNPRVFMSMLYTLQTLLITLRIDQTLLWDWKIILVVGWLYLGTVAAHFSFYVWLLICVCVPCLFSRYLRRNMSKKLYLVGFTWYVCYYGLSFIGFFVIAGIDKALQEKANMEFLKNTALGMLNMNALLVLLTILIFKPLMKFIKQFSQPLQLFGNSRPIYLRPQRTVIYLRAEKSENYFTMISSTYFTPLTKSYSKQNTRSLEKIKRTFSNIKLGRSSSLFHKVIAHEETKSERKWQCFQQDKTVLDKRLGKILSEGHSINKSKMDKLYQPLSDRSINHMNTSRIETNQKENLKVSTAEGKLNLSADNVSDLEKMDIYSRQRETGDRENTCYLCYERAPNSVLMGCGHGGMCYECAAASMKIKNECVECRSRVEGIYKIDSKPKLMDIFRATELTRIVVGPFLFD